MSHQRYCHREKASCLGFQSGDVGGGCALDGPSNTKEDIQELVAGLRNKDHNYAYQCLNQLESVCISSNAVYAYFTTLVEMLDDPNSYV